MDRLVPNHAGTKAEGDELDSLLAATSPRGDSVAGSAKWLVLRVVLLGFVIGTSLGCRSKESQPLSLIWVSLDTLRADHLSLFGYPRDTSPFLDSLAAKGLSFRWVVAPQNSTLPSHMTMFTGYHPVVHGIMHSKRNRGVRLDPSVETLPKVLQRAGYATRAWTDGGQISGHFGFSGGFDEYREKKGPFPSKCSEALATLDQMDPDHPFFFMIHTYEVHGPYEPDPPYDTLFSAPPGSDRPARRMALYDGSIRLVDDALREFVKELEQRGLLDRTILVVTSDHGESFHEFEIPHTGHGKQILHQNITRVPWILLHPDERFRGRGVIDELVGLIDFPNTILGLLNRPERLGQGGENVLAARENARPRDYMSWCGEPAWSLYTGPYHFLRAADGSHQRNGFYDVEADPFERAPLDDPRVHAILSKRFDELSEDLKRERDRLQSTILDHAPVPGAVEERLRELGYLEDSEEPSPGSKPKNR